jgi:acyl dehydratase
VHGSIAHMRIVVSQPADLTSRVGEHLGWSTWHTVTQAGVDHFAEATGNRAPIHTDPEFARATPYGTTIAFGIQVLAMATMLLDDIWELRATNGVDVGSNKVRHLAPVRVGTGVRLGVRVVSAELVPATTGVPDGVRATLELTFEAEGSERPACIAEIVFIYWF